LIENPQRNNNKKEKKNEKEIKYMLPFNFFLSFQYFDVVYIKYPNWGVFQNLIV
jgi:hypothetical protein